MLLKNISLGLLLLFCAIGQAQNEFLNLYGDEFNNTSIRAKIFNNAIYTVNTHGSDNGRQTVFSKIDFDGNIVWQLRIGNHTVIEDFTFDDQNTFYLVGHTLPLSETRNNYSVFGKVIDNGTSATVSWVRHYNLRNRERFSQIEKKKATASNQSPEYVISAVDVFPHTTRNITYLIGVDANGNLLSKNSYSAWDGMFYQNLIPDAQGRYTMLGNIKFSQQFFGTYITAHSDLSLYEAYYYDTGTFFHDAIADENGNKIIVGTTNNFSSGEGLIARIKLGGDVAWSLKVPNTTKLYDITKLQHSMDDTGRHIYDYYAIGRSVIDSIERNVVLKFRSACVHSIESEIVCQPNLEWMRYLYDDISSSAEGSLSLTSNNKLLYFDSKMTDDGFGKNDLFLGVLPPDLGNCNVKEKEVSLETFSLTPTMYQLTPSSSEVPDFREVTKVYDTNYQINVCQPKGNCEPIDFSCPTDVAVKFSPESSCEVFVDNIAPIIKSDCPYNLSYTINGSTEASGEGEINSGFFNVGETTVTYNLDTHNGDSFICSFDVYVLDTIPPSIACPQDILAFADCSQDSVGVLFQAPSASDNCSSLTITGTHASGDFFPVGTTLVTYFAEDASGNIDSCTFNVTIKQGSSDIPIQINCFENINNFVGCNDTTAIINSIAPVIIGSCAYTLSYTTSGATVMTGIGDISGSLFNLGTTIVTYTVTDTSGMSAHCTFRVVVEKLTEGCNANISGNISRPDDFGISDVTIKFIQSLADTFLTTTDNDGNYRTDVILSGNNFIIRPSKKAVNVDGLSIADVHRLNNLLLGQALNSPYEAIAGDVNQDGFLDGADRVLIMNAINTNIPLEDSWQFVDKKYRFHNVYSGLGGTFPQEIIVEGFPEDTYDFYAIKKGDLVTNLNLGKTNLSFDITDMEDCIVQGDTIEIEVNIEEGRYIGALQFSLGWDEHLFEVVQGRTTGHFFDRGFENVFLENNFISYLWSNQRTDTLATGETILTLALRAKTDQVSVAEICFSNDIPFEMVDGAGNIYNSFSSENECGIIANTCAEDCLEENLSTSDDLTGLLQTQGSIEASGQLSANKEVNFVAGDTIRLKPGFRATEGISFRAKIGACHFDNITNAETDETFDLPLEQRTQTLENLALKVAPNPFSSSTNIRFYLPGSTQATLTIHDLSGKVLTTIQTDVQQQGWQATTFYPEKLAGGVYYLVLRTAQEVKSEKIVVLK